MAKKEAQDAQGASGKKGGKLQIILLLVIVLLAGGFFGSKLGGGKSEPKEKELKLGKVYEFDEFLVNLRDPDTYARAQIALHFEDGFATGHMEELLPPMRDVIILKLSSMSSQGLQSGEGKAKLKKELAAALNHRLHALHGDDHAKGSGGKKGSSPKKSAAGGHDDAHEEEAEEDLKHPDWDSQEGPVLKVYFTNLAIQ